MNRCFCLLVLVAALLARRTQAEPDNREIQTPVRLAFRSSGDCPGLEQFERGIAAKTPHYRRAQGEEVARSFQIDLEYIRGRARGLLWDSSESSSAARSVAAGTCAEVASALAFTIALAIDQDASSTDSSIAKATIHEASSADSSVATSEATTQGGGRSGSVKRPTEQGRSAIGQRFVARSRGEAQLPPLGPQLPKAKWSFSAGFGGTAFLAALPDALAGPSVHVEAIGPGSGWQPTLRMRGLYLRGAASDRENVDFDLVSLDAEFCPVRLHPERFALSACGIGGGGVLAGTGRGGAKVKTARFPWLIVGLTIRSSWNFYGSWDLEVSASAIEPLYRASFVTELPRTVVATTHAPASALEAGVSYRFW